MLKIEAVRIVSGKSELAIVEGGADARILTTDQTTYFVHGGRLPDLLAYLQKETEPTRNPIFDIVDEPPQSRNESLAALMRRMHICEERVYGKRQAVYPEPGNGVVE